MSLRWKIALSLAAVALVATALVGVISYRSASERLVEEVDRAIEQASGIVLQRPGGAPGRFPDRGLVDVYEFQWIDERGEATPSRELELPVEGPAVDVVGSPGARARQTVVVDGERYRVHSIGFREGAFQIVRSLDETDRVLDDLRTRTALLVLFVSAGAAIVGWLLAGTAAGPLRRLTRAAQQVEASGNLEVELPDAGRDEVGTMTRAFRSMLDALSRSRLAQQRLVQDAGHELRTPLTSLRTNLAVLRRHRDLPDDTQERILTDLDGEVTELATLVDELVAAASGHLSEEPVEELTLGRVAEQVATRVSRRRGRDVAVTVAADPLVLAPPTGVERALSNLVDNACKFDETDSTIEVVVDGGAIHVLDRGPGIPEAERELVLERFHRTEPARAKPGSGLGLSIVNDIVTSHGGRVTVASREGGGADIGFTLPLA